MYGAGGVGNGTGGQRTGFDGGFHGQFDIPQVIQRVENADNIDAVGYAALNKAHHHVIGVMLITQQVLTAQEHLQFGMGHFLPERPQPLPRVFVQITETRVKCGAAPTFYGIISRPIHLGKNGFHHINGHTRCNQRLIGVTQDCFGELHFWHIPLPPHVYITTHGQGE